MSIINYLTKIHFEAGVLTTALPQETTRLAIRRPLIVTDKGVAAAGLLDQLHAALPALSTATVFDETPANPTEAALDSALELYRSEDCDGLIGFGGGSPIDLAKGVAMMVKHDPPLFQYAAVEGGIARIAGGLPPLIAVPTTAGTGTEVGRGAILVLNDRRKLGFISQHLIPSVAICDPTLTLGLPPVLTAGTGMDALTHCVETYIATVYNPPADGIALDGLERAALNLEQAVTNGTDLEARREMMAAAMNGALAFQKGLGGVHAISHALGGLAGYQLHHGTLNAVLLPHILEFNEPASGHRYAALRRAMHLDKGANIADEIRALNRRIGMPAGLGVMGVDQTAIEAAAPLAEKDHTNATNPRSASAEDYLAIMQAAL